jgi:hypothetical protein
MCGSFTRFINLETAIVTDLNELLEAETAPISAEKRSGDERMYANESIVAGMSGNDSYSQAYKSCPDLPDDLTPIDDVFFGRIRALASLI